MTHMDPSDTSGEHYEQGIPYGGKETPQNIDPTIDNWLRRMLGGPKGPLGALGVLPQSPGMVDPDVAASAGPLPQDGPRLGRDPQLQTNVPIYAPDPTTLDTGVRGGAGDYGLQLLSPGEEGGSPTVQPSTAAVSQAVRPSFGDIPVAQGQDDPAEPPRGFHPGYPGLAPETTTTPSAPPAPAPADPLPVAATDTSGMDVGDILSGVMTTEAGAPSARPVQPSPVTTPIPVPTPAIPAAATGQETFAGDDAMGGQLPGSPGGLIGKLGGGIRREMLDPLLRAITNREGGSAEAVYPNYEPDPVPAPNIPQAAPAPIVPTPTVVPDMPDSNLVQQPPPPPPPLPPQAPRSDAVVSEADAILEANPQLFGMQGDELSFALQDLGVDRDVLLYIHELVTDQAESADIGDNIF